MNPASLSTNNLWRMLAAQLSIAITPFDDDRELLRKIVGANNVGQTFNDLMRVWLGSDSKPGDSDWDLMRKKLATVANTFIYGDTFRDMLAKYVLGSAVSFSYYGWDNTAGLYTEFSTFAAAFSFTTDPARCVMTNGVDYWVISEVAYGPAGVDLNSAFFNDATQSFIDLFTDMLAQTSSALAQSVAMTSVRGNYNLAGGANVTSPTVGSFTDAGNWAKADSGSFSGANFS